jgi:hypothetical protein
MFNRPALAREPPPSRATGLGAGGGDGVRTGALTG